MFLYLLFVAAQIVVISHRGEHLAHPENTLPAFEGAIAAGADYFELDVRTTANGKLVLMHDATVDRTTNGHGRVREMTLEQIRALDAGVKFGAAFAGTEVPTFEEALRMAHGRIGVYVDCKDIAAEDLVGMLEKTEMSDKVVIYGGSGFLKKVLTLRPGLKAMPEADNSAALAKAAAELHLTVAAFDEGDFKDDVIATAKREHVEIYVDRLWKQDDQAHWQDAVDRGADGIQTDKPANVVAFLKASGKRK